LLQGADVEICSGGMKYGSKEDPTADGGGEKLAANSACSST
jgi:hypothetical protein